MSSESPDPTEAPTDDQRALLRADLAGDLDAPTEDLTVAHRGDQLFRSRALAECYALVYAASTPDPGISGSELVTHLGEVSNVSPGSVYPVLHELRDVGLLDTIDLPQRTTYVAGDVAALDAHLETYEAYLSALCDRLGEARAALDTPADTAESEPASDSWAAVDADGGE